MGDQRSLQELQKALCAPFDAKEVKFKPQTVSGNRALPVAYIDARVVEQRLDDVMGSDGWEDDYEQLPSGVVVCRLTVHFPDRSVTKCDVGGESKQPELDDRAKSAYSDALKRAAVKFGIGRYLYGIKMGWCDFDPQKKQFVTKPTMPGQPKPAVASQARPMVPSDPPPAHAPEQCVSPITLDQLDKIDQCCVALNWTHQKLCDSLKLKFKKDDPKKLSVYEAASVVKGMEAEIAKRSSTTTQTKAA